MASVESKRPSQFSKPVSPENISIRVDDADLSASRPFKGPVSINLVPSDNALDAPPPYTTAGPVTPSAERVRRSSFNVSPNSAASSHRGSAVDKFRRGSVVSNNPDGNLLSPASNESSLRVNPQSSPRAADAQNNLAVTPSSRGHARRGSDGLDAQASPVSAPSSNGHSRRASSVGHGRRPSILPEQAALNIPQEYVIRTVSNGREISSWCVNDVGVNDWYACDFVTACTFRWWDILAIHEPLRLLLLLAQSHLDNPKFPGPIEEKGWRVFNFFRWFNEYLMPVLLNSVEFEEGCLFLEMTENFPESVRKTIESKSGNLVKDHHADLHSMSESQMAPLLVAFKNLFEKPPAGENAAAERLQTIVKELLFHYKNFVASVFEHLFRVECLMAPLLRIHMDSTSTSTNVLRITKGMSENEDASLLPILILTMKKWGGEERQKAFIAKLPNFVTAKLSEMVPEYKKKWESLLNSIISEKNMVVEPPQSCCVLL